MLWAMILIAHVGVALWLMSQVLRSRREAAEMLAWMLALLLLPGLGAVLYVVFGSNRLQRKIARRRARVARVVAALRDSIGAADAPAALQPELSPEARGVAQLAQRLSGMPALGCNHVELLTDGQLTFAALEQQVSAAQRDVHLLYYIWRADETGRRLRDLLVRQARSGVRCRVLLDAVGSLSIGRRFTRPLRDAGVQLAYYLPLWPLRRRVTLNLRNHRKLAVIDGHTALLGSQNIGDEYLSNGRLSLRPWYDAQLLIRGPAARLAQTTFAEDWLLATGEVLHAQPEMPNPSPQGASVVQLLPTGPDLGSRGLRQVVFSAAAWSRHSLRIATPYFAPDAATIAALVSAALRGVQVQLIIARRTDVPVLLWAARSHYPELLEAGVSVHEFDAGVLHAKLLVVDDLWSMLGSANMDIRSFDLNYELTALVYDPLVARRVAALADQYAAGAVQVTAREASRRGALQELLQGAARAISPLL